MAESIAFDPQAGFIVTASSKFANFNDDTFVTLYQPIIGPVAFSLFYVLKANLRLNPTIAERRLHSNLLSQVNAGGRAVAEAIHRLEAVGILQTYYQHDELGDLFVYQLQSTLTPEEFIDDNLLSILLLEEVGDYNFKRLVNRGRQYQLASSNVKLKNISHHFFDEFQVSSQSVATTPQIITTARKSSPVEHKMNLSKDLAGEFDWQTLNGLLANQPIIKEDIEEQRELILIEHQLYGIDEPTMQQLILRSVDLQSNHFNAQKFKQIVASTYNIVYTDKNDKVAESKESADKSSGQHTLSAKDQQLLKSVSGYSPVEFLQVLKGQTGGYVTSGERHLLKRLLEDGKLPVDAINILSWYVIAERDHSTLSANFVDTIANSWIRKKIVSGKDALLQLKNYQQTVSSSNKKVPAKKNRWRKTINEPMPEWSKKDSKELNKKASAKTIADLKKQIANLNK